MSTGNVSKSCREPNLVPGAMFQPILEPAPPGLRFVEGQPIAAMEGPWRKFHGMLICKTHCSQGQLSGQRQRPGGPAAQQTQLSGRSRSSRNRWAAGAACSGIGG